MYFLSVSYENLLILAMLKGIAISRLKIFNESSPFQYLTQSFLKDRYNVLIKLDNIYIGTSSLKRFESTR